MWFFSYLIFRFKASNLHGTHSPFVYELAKYCVFNPQWKRHQKVLFKRTGIKILTEIFHQNLQEFLKINNHKMKREIVSLSKNETSLFSEKVLIIQNKTDEMLLFTKNVHLNRGLWNREIQTKKLIVIDFFFWGILIKRKQKYQLFLLKVF